MTKQEFLSGIEFTISDKPRNHNTYKFQPIQNRSTEGIITRLLKTSTGEVVLEEYECNVEKITNNTITYYTSLMGFIVRKRTPLNKYTAYQNQE